MIRLTHGVTSIYHHQHTQYTNIVVNDELVQSGACVVSKRPARLQCVDSHPPQTPASSHTTARRGDAVPYKEARTRCRRRSTHWCNYTKPWDAVQLVALAKDSRNFPAIENREELMNLAGERVNLQRITRKLTHRRDIISFEDMMHS